MQYAAASARLCPRVALLYMIFAAYLMLASAAVQVNALTEVSEVVLQRMPMFSAKVNVRDVRANSVVTIYVPYNLADAVYEAPADATCTSEMRNVFEAAHGELAVVRCRMGSTRYNSAYFFVNGTLVFEPVRFIVSVCPDSEDEEVAKICWSNEASWRSPSAYDQLMSCQLVAGGVLVFWCLVALAVCMCLCRQRCRDRQRNRTRRLIRTAAPYYDDDDSTTGGETDDDDETMPAEAEAPDDSGDDAEKQKANAAAKRKASKRTRAK